MRAVSHLRLLGVAGLVAAGSVVVASQGSAAPEPRYDPDAVVSYTLTSGGTALATFGTLVELPSEVEVIEYRQGTATGEEAVRLLPGKPVRTTVVLERGLTSGLELWTWHEQARSGAQSLARDIALTGHNRAGTAVVRWNLASAWPSAVRYADPAEGAAVETATLVAENVERVAP
jgi:phage tail-like protein